MQSCTLVSAVLAFLQLSVAYSGLNGRGQNLAIRQTSSQPSCPELHPHRSNGGRKIAFLIDGTSQMKSLDPYRFWIPAAESINDALISQSEATDGHRADLAIVMDENWGYSKIVAPLGDPSSIDFRGVGSEGGYEYPSALDVAMDKLNITGGDSSRLGLVWLTSRGFDEPARPLPGNWTILSGIRVSYGLLVGDYGYLSGSNTTEMQKLSIILKDGGIFCIIHDRAALQSFASLVIANGPTGSDNGTIITTLIAGHSLATLLFPSGSANFTYQSQPGEIVELSVDCGGSCNVNVTLSNLSNGTTLSTSNTGHYDESGIFGHHFSPLISTGTDVFKLELTSSDSTSDQVVFVSTKSSLGAANCTTDAVALNVTPSPSPSASASSSSAASEHGLSVGAKVGIGIGAAAIGLAILLAAFLCVRRRKRGRSGASPTDAMMVHEKAGDGLEVSTGEVYPKKAELPGLTDHVSPVELMTTEPKTELEAPSYGPTAPTSPAELGDTRMRGADGNAPLSPQYGLEKDVRSAPSKTPGEPFGAAPMTQAPEPADSSIALDAAASSAPNPPATTAGDIKSRSS